jgi:hypothetical protein
VNARVVIIAETIDEEREEREREREHSTLLAVYFEGENESKFPPLHPGRRKRKTDEKYTQKTDTDRDRDRETERESKRNEKSARTSSVVHHFSSFATDELEPVLLGEKFCCLLLSFWTRNRDRETETRRGTSFSLSLFHSKGGT